MRWLRGEIYVWKIKLWYTRTKEEEKCDDGDAPVVAIVIMSERGESHDAPIYRLVTTPNFIIIIIY